MKKNIQLTETEKEIKAVNSKNKKAKTYKANMDLRKRIGPGPLDKSAIERAQSAIEENEIDFAPMGLEFLKTLENALNIIAQDPNSNSTAEQIKTLIAPVMELKANATIFHYALVGNLANIMLNFLESLNALDKDALSIVRGHHDSLKLILSNNMKGDGGKDGQVMMSELKDACARYYKKIKNTKK